jgi:VCBS repeat-containing protein
MAMDIQASNVEIHNSTLSASGATNNYGIYTSASTGSYTVQINNSQIIVPSTDATVRSDNNFVIQIGASLLSGGNINTAAGGTVNCVGVYDENYGALYTGSCP